MSRDYRRRLLVLVLAMGAAGCGEETPASPPSDRAQITATIQDYLKAYVTGLGRDACGAYTPRLRAESEQRAQAADVRGGCAAVLSKVGSELVKQLPAATREKELKRITAPRVAIQTAGERALTTLTIPGEQESQGNRMELERRNGTWKISRLAIPRGVDWP